MFFVFSEIKTTVPLWLDHPLPSPSMLEGLGLVETNNRVTCQATWF
ncbi:hypothetical protein RBSH_06138 [Rhodopirellula baltica SH28]|uniref:Uncharacterized protein n=1 Tax=Rhodopirellula baltica SH28 TaxID=993517 RepID=K5C6Z8_RHOBT|nr:hypothetical protein RBSH_06138 [Rhodopirellula baltica SH28]